MSTEAKETDVVSGGQGWTMGLDRAKDRKDSKTLLFPN